MADSRKTALHKHVRIAPEHWVWASIRRENRGTPHSPNQILVELAMDALDGREWAVTEVENRDFISTIVPDIDDTPTAANRSDPQNHATNNGGQRLP